MSRLRVALTIAGVAVAAGVLGYGVGLLCAPASGAELRRRIAWRAADQRKLVARSCERLFDRAADRAKQELSKRVKQVAETVGAKG